MTLSYKYVCAAKCNLIRSIWQDLAGVETVVYDDGSHGQQHQGRLSDGNKREGGERGRSTGRPLVPLLSSLSGWRVWRKDSRPQYNTTSFRGFGVFHLRFW